MYYPSLEEFREKSRSGNLIPVYREILADLETPVSAFLKIDDGRHSFLLESVQGGEKWARYSFLGSGPAKILRYSRGRFEILSKERRIRSALPKEPLDALREVMSVYRPVPVEGLPPFFGGAVGYFSYELVRDFESLPLRDKPGLGFPEIYLLITDTILVFDRLRQRIKIVANAQVGKDPDKAYRDAVRRIDALFRRLGQPLPRTLQQGPPRVPSRVEPKASNSGRPKASNRNDPKASNKGARVRSNITQAEYEKIVLRAKEYIAAGDIFQVVPSQRFEVPLRARPFDVYRALRVINPSPYMYYLRLGEIEIAGSSPEVLVRCEGGRVELRPIAGTRRRGHTEEEDTALCNEMREDQKERAEHLMLVDLGRNDVGRVSQAGSVRVNELMTVESYSHVMHLVSHIEGRLLPGRDACDVLRACFPAGTVSGAPKIRAMQIIDELEPTQRGPYAGAVGYLSFSGNLDTCINIRTLLFRRGKAYIQAGGGVVADSDPAMEYTETVNKARAVIAAIEMAERGL